MAHLVCGGEPDLLCVDDLVLSIRAMRGQLKFYDLQSSVRRRLCSCESDLSASQ